MKNQQNRPQTRSQPRRQCGISWPVTCDLLDWTGICLNLTLIGEEGQPSAVVLVEALNLAVDVQGRALLSWLSESSEALAGGRALRTVSHGPTVPQQAQLLGNPACQATAVQAATLNLDLSLGAKAKWRHIGATQSVVFQLHVCVCGGVAQPNLEQGFGPTQGSLLTRGGGNRTWHR